MTIALVPKNITDIRLGIIKARRAAGTLQEDKKALSEIKNNLTVITGRNDISDDEVKGFLQNIHKLDPKRIPETIESLIRIDGSKAELDFIPELLEDIENYIHSDRRVVSTETKLAELRAEVKSRAKADSSLSVKEIQKRDVEIKQRLLALGVTPKEKKDIPNEYFTKDILDIRAAINLEAEAAAGELNTDFLSDLRVEYFYAKDRLSKSGLLNDDGSPITKDFNGHNLNHVFIVTHIPSGKKFCAGQDDLETIFKDDPVQRSVIEHLKEKRENTVDEYKGKLSLLKEVSFIAGEERDSVRARIEALEKIDKKIFADSNFDDVNDLFEMFRGLWQEHWEKQGKGDWVKNYDLDSFIKSLKEIKRIKDCENIQTILTLVNDGKSPTDKDTIERNLTFTRGDDLTVENVEFLVKLFTDLKTTQDTLAEEYQLLIHDTPHEHDPRFDLGTLVGQAEVKIAHELIGKPYEGKSILNISLDGPRRLSETIKTICEAHGMDPNPITDKLTDLDPVKYEKHVHPNIERKITADVRKITRDGMPEIRHLPDGISLEKNSQDVIIANCLFNRMNGKKDAVTKALISLENLLKKPGDTNARLMVVMPPQHQLTQSKFRELLRVCGYKEVSPPDLTKNEAVDFNIRAGNNDSAKRIVSKEFEFTVFEKVEEKTSEQIADSLKRLDDSFFITRSEETHQGNGDPDNIRDYYEYELNPDYLEGLALISEADAATHFDPKSSEPIPRADIIKKSEYNNFEERLAVLQYYSSGENKDSHLLTKHDKRKLDEILQLWDNDFSSSLTRAQVDFIMNRPLERTVPHEKFSAGTQGIIKRTYPEQCTLWEAYVEERNYRLANTQPSILSLTGRNKPLHEKIKYAFDKRLEKYKDYDRKDLPEVISNPTDDDRKSMDDISKLPTGSLSFWVSDGISNEAEALSSFGVDKVGICSTLGLINDSLGERSIYTSPSLLIKNDELILYFKDDGTDQFTQRLQAFINNTRFTNQMISRIGIHAERVNRLVSGKDEPFKEEVKFLANLFCVSPEVLDPYYEYRFNQLIEFFGPPLPPPPPPEPLTDIVLTDPPIDPPVNPLPDTDPVDPAPVDPAPPTELIILPAADTTPPVDEPVVPPSDLTPPVDPEPITPPIDSTPPVDPIPPTSTPINTTPITLKCPLSGAEITAEPNADGTFKRKDVVDFVEESLAALEFATQNKHLEDEIVTRTCIQVIKNLWDEQFVLSLNRAQLDYLTTILQSSIKSNPSVTIEKISRRKHRNEDLINKYRPLLSKRIADAISKKRIDAVRGLDNASLDDMTAAVSSVGKLPANVSTGDPNKSLYSKNFQFQKTHIISPRRLLTPEHVAKLFTDKTPVKERIICLSHNENYSDIGFKHLFTQFLKDNYNAPDAVAEDTYSLIEKILKNNTYDRTPDVIKNPALVALAKFFEVKPSDIDPKLTGEQLDFPVYSGSISVSVTATPAPPPAAPTPPPAPTTTPGNIHFSELGAVSEAEVNKLINDRENYKPLDFASIEERIELYRKLPENHTGRRDINENVLVDLALGVVEQYLRPQDVDLPQVNDAYDSILKSWDKHFDLTLSAENREKLINFLMSVKSWGEGSDDLIPDIEKSRAKSLVFEHGLREKLDTEMKRQVEGIGDNLIHNPNNYINGHPFHQIIHYTIPKNTPPDTVKASKHFIESISADPASRGQTIHHAPARIIPHKELALRYNLLHSADERFFTHVANQNVTLFGIVNILPNPSDSKAVSACEEIFLGNIDFAKHQEMLQYICLAAFDGLPITSLMPACDLLDMSSPVSSTSTAVPKPTITLELQTPISALEAQNKKDTELIASQGRNFRPLDSMSLADRLKLYETLPQDIDRRDLNEAIIIELYLAQLKDNYRGEQELHDRVKKAWDEDFVITLPGELKKELLEALDKNRFYMDDTQSTLTSSLNSFITKAEVYAKRDSKPSQLFSRPSLQKRIETEFKERAKNITTSDLLKHFTEDTAPEGFTNINNLPINDGFISGIHVEHSSSTENIINRACILAPSDLVKRFTALNDTNDRLDTLQANINLLNQELDIYISYISPDKRSTDKTQIGERCHVFGVRIIDVLKGFDTVPENERDIAEAKLMADYEIANAAEANKATKLSRGDKSKPKTISEILDETSSRITDESNHLFIEITKIIKNGLGSRKLTLEQANGILNASREGSRGIVNYLQQTLKFQQSRSTNNSGEIFKAIRSHLSGLAKSD